MSVITDEVDITEANDSGVIAPAGRHHALVLVGGKGVRLRPYTTVIPKPLVPIADEHSILEIVLCQLARDGFTSATLAIGHLGQLIRAYVGDGSQWGIDVDYVQEASPLGTIGPALTMLDRLPDHFLLMNGDVLTDLDFRELVRAHKESGNLLTIAAHSRANQIDYGVIHLGEGDPYGTSEVVCYEEKPQQTFFVSMGVYVLEPEALEFVPDGRFDFPDLVSALVAANKRVGAYPYSGFWLDIGRPEDYQEAVALWDDDGEGSPFDETKTEISAPA
jgi:NDP-mannose synthase